jgi:hypothetical protein
MLIWMIRTADGIIPHVPSFPARNSYGLMSDRPDSNEYGPIEYMDSWKTLIYKMLNIHYNLVTPHIVVPDYFREGTSQKP